MHLAWPHNLRPILAAVLLLGGVLASGAAAADDLWKCTAADGSVAYVNTHVDEYRNCRRIKVPGAEPGPAPRAEPVTGAWTYAEPRAAAPDAATESAAAPAAVPDGAAGATRIVRGSVYRVRRPDGVQEYTNIRPRAGRGEVALLFHYIATCRACDVHSPVDWENAPLQLARYRREINAAAADYGLDAGLLRALIHAESAFDPLALSAKGAQGLTQLMPGTASDLGVTDVFDPEENIRGGARYLAGLLRDFNGDERLATAAYNAGPGAVRRHAGVPPYAETQVYVDRVALLARRYRAAGAAGGATAATAVSALVN